MTFEEALKHEENNEPVIYNNRKYYVVGYNKSADMFTIREASGDQLFTVPIDAKVEELS
ncbi:hypothetical protein [Limosilactobacillus reuteri]|uniref:Uncharacterized protein n=1 Tax=Limosilactobacillus reuteri subsp. rodentium (strain DSM 17509 / CIP 109821 / 100-23) TaxID=349123 RepID=B3XNJ6_LIMR1|nr:hypothetical protein [Limosilactobacillus reuteri]EDX42702.1 hypothetical protein Lreu23DRAFT_4218 [Limosilactobacillus reuteri subsp. rodentium]MCC4474920.1 hypothetical protein [Limosilactobacillus reuteri]